LLTLGPYAPEDLTGPAIWLRCVVAGTFPEVELPEGAPSSTCRASVGRISGPSRAALPRCNRSPSCRTGGLLQPPQRPRLEAGGLSAVQAWGEGRGERRDAAGTRPRPPEAAGRARTDAGGAVSPQSRVPRLPAHGERIKGEDPAAWAAFCRVCADQYGFDPVADGDVTAAGFLGERRDAWRNVWRLFADAPRKYPHLQALLERAAGEDDALRAALVMKLTILYYSDAREAFIKAFGES
jgi:hypothetical protein